MNKNVISNTEIISHIRNCCGHADFIDHLLLDSPLDFVDGLSYSPLELIDELSDSPVQDTFAELSDSLVQYRFDCVDSRYFLFFALILDRDFHNNPLYKRLWTCIPILKRIMVTKLETIWHDVNITRYILKDCNPIEPRLIIDFITCIDKLKSCGGTVFGKDLMILKALVGCTSLDINLKIEDVGRLIEQGEELPDVIVNIYHNSANIVRHSDEIMGYFRKKFEVKLSKIHLHLRIMMQYLYGGDDSYRSYNLETAVKIYNDDDQDPIITMGTNSLGLCIYDDLVIVNKQEMIDRSEGRLSGEGLQQLLEGLCGAGIPMYLHSDPIFIKCRSSAKSARK